MVNATDQADASNSTYPEGLLDSVAKHFPSAVTDQASGSNLKAMEGDGNEGDGKIIW